MFLMPMPNIQVLLAFLEDYFKIKEEESKTVTGMAKNLFRNLTEERKKLIEKYKAKFTAAKTTADWANIIVNLGIDARVAQNEKYSSGDSELALTLNAMRTYIINMLCKDPVLNKQYEAEINDRLILLNTGTKATRAGQSDKLSLRAQYYKDDSDGVSVETSKTSLENMLLALADLGHAESLAEVLHLKLLTYHIPKDAALIPDFKGHVNMNHPLCYQKTFEVMFYMQYMSKFHPVPDELKQAWGISLDKKDEYLRYSEFIAQIEKESQSLSSDKLTTQLATRAVRGHNFPTEAGSASGTQPLPASLRGDVQASRPPQPGLSSTEDSVATLDSSPVRKHQSTPPKPSAAFFPLDGATWPSRAATAPQLVSQNSEEREDKEVQTEESRSSSPSFSLRRSSE